MKKFKPVKDSFQDGINIRESIAKAGRNGKEKRKSRREMNELASEYIALRNGRLGRDNIEYW